MGKYRIEIKRSVTKEIDRLPKNDLKRVLAKIETLAENPRPFDCQKLSAQEKYRVRVGDYRIIYSIEDDILIVFIVKVAHRREAYR